MDEPRQFPEAEARAVADIVARHITPHVLDARRGNVGSAPIVALPDGFSLHSLKPVVDEYLPAPPRRKGTAQLSTLDAFVEHANRFKDPDSVIFSDRGKIDGSRAPSLTAVLDYHRAGPNRDQDEIDPTAAGSARFGAHRGVYYAPFSREWLAWAQAEAEPRGMNQADFAEFLEDRGVDLIDPPALTGDLSDADRTLRDLAGRLNLTFGGVAAIMELSRGLRVFAEEKVANVTNLATGEGEIRFEIEHRDEAGKPLKIPGLFLIAIPVFDRGAVYRVPVRLRYRKVGGAVVWRVIRHRPEAVFDHAVDEIAATAAERTGLPVYSGQPE